MRIKDNSNSGCCGLIALPVWIYAVVCWLINCYKLFSHCDWSTQTSMKEEVIHLIGLFVAPSSMITAWL